MKIASARHRRIARRTSWRIREWFWRVSWWVRKNSNHHRSDRSANLEEESALKEDQQWSKGWKSEVSKTVETPFPFRVLHLQKKGNKSIIRLHPLPHSELAHAQFVRWVLRGEPPHSRVSAHRSRVSEKQLTARARLIPHHWRRIHREMQI